jgi:hypothetical protein
MRPSLLILAILSLAVSQGCKRVMLDERFHDARLSNWTVIDDPDCVEIPSDWSVGKDGRLHQQSNIWGRRGDFIGRWYGTLIVAGREDWGDYLFTVKARPRDDDGFGVVFRFVDAEHFYRLLFLRDGLSGGPITRLDKREGAEYTELWSTRRGYRPDAEMMIEVSVTGDTIRAKVDGQPLVEVKDGSYARGKVGLFCYAQSGQEFDEVKVESQ